jgi:riboflavin synthase
MFTGLVAECGVVERVTRRGTGVELRIRSTFTRYEPGESIACDGVCLTVETHDASGFTVLAGDETLRVTTLGAVGAGDRIHLERALRLGDRLGGHWVQGHVDGVGHLRAVEPGPEWTKLVFTAPEALRRYLVTKGSICVSGVSLTVNEVDALGFAVGIIPHTLHLTRLGALAPGAPVNLEVDVLAKYVERLMNFALPTADAGARGVGMDTLRAAGFAAGEER